jgi:hypothetical protein
MALSPEGNRAVLKGKNRVAQGREGGAEFFPVMAGKRIHPVFISWREKRKTRKLSRFYVTFCLFFLSIQEIY